MTIILATLLSFFCKTGTLTNDNGKTNLYLKCSDSKEESCYFDVNLPIGGYMYVSYDKKDTTYLFVGDTQNDSYLFKTSGNFTFVE